MYRANTLTSTTTKLKASDVNCKGLDEPFRCQVLGDGKLHAVLCAITSYMHFWQQLHCYLWSPLCTLMAHPACTAMVLEAVTLYTSTLACTVGLTA